MSKTMEPHIRQYLGRLVREAQQQGCLQEVMRHREVFIVFIVCVDEMMSSALEKGFVTLPEVCQWLDEILWLYGEESDVSS